jgi:hypothetical protein
MYTTLTSILNKVFDKKMYNYAAIMEFTPKHIVYFKTSLNYQDLGSRLVLFQSDLLSPQIKSYLRDRSLFMIGGRGIFSFLNF